MSLYKPMRVTVYNLHKHEVLDSIHKHEVLDSICIYSYILLNPCSIHFALE